MKLTAVKLHNFKSFAQSNSFPLEASLTGIVGPNGCGKSNIIDAVRWVLGESAAKQLRGQESNDVIFAGSNDRNAAGYAQVELHFAQGEQRLSGQYGEFDEIVISRRLQRDGQSQYQINQRTVRRRDIVELLQMVGIKARSYAIIEQGMIGRIIEGKPEEIRSFIEEAAGIALYKSRRKESETRLESVAADLQRHDERLDNLSKQKEKLAREAKSAEKHQQLQQEQRFYNQQLRSFKHHELSQMINEVAAEISQAEEKKTVLENSQAVQRLQHLEENFQQKQENLQQAKKLHLSALQQQSQSEKKREELNLRRQFNNQQLEALQEIFQQIEDELLQKETLKEEITNEIRQLEAAINAHAPQLLRLQENLQQEQRKQEQLRLQQQQQLQQEQQLLQRKQRLRQELQAQNQQISNWQERSRQLQEQLKNNQEILDYQIDKLQENKDILQEKYENLQEKQQISLEEYQEQNLLLQQLKFTLTQAQQEKSALESKIQPSFPELARVWELLEINPLWQKGLENYLGSALTIAFAKDKKYWQEALQQGNSIIGAGNIPHNWQAIIKSELDLSLFLTNIEALPKHDKDVQALDLAENKNYLTLDGSLINKNSYLNFSKNKENKLLDLQKISAKIPELVAKIDEQAEKVNKLEQQKNYLNQELQQLKSACQQAENDLQEAKQKQLLQEQQQILRQHQLDNLSALQEDIKQLQERAADSDEALLMLEEELLILQENKVDFLESEDLIKVQNNYQQAEKLQRERQQQQLKLQMQLQNQQEQQQRLHQEQVKQNEKKRLQTQENNHLKMELESLQQLLEAQKEETKIALQELQYCEQEQILAQESLQEEERLFNKEKQELQILQERLTLQNAQIKQLELQKSAYEEEFASENLEILTFEPEEKIDVAALQEKIRDLKQDLSALGAVNFSAIDDFAIIAAEHNQLEEQCNDLRESLALIQNAMDALDNETKKRLNDTFAAVNQYFSENLARLFKGGTGFLSWNDKDILQAGVNINVTLMGKKNRHLSALSGGEKALSALSLVFAFFRLQPAPFCMLDEVDAPLDEANVERLGALLKDMSQHTQLLMITHHKRSMENCDALIGVTMSEPGVSRLVGVKFQ